MSKRGSGWRGEALRVLTVCALFVACEPPPPPGGGGGTGLPFEVPTDQILPTEPVGALPGSLSAGLDGQASYRVPLEVPRGRAGMQPHLTLTYRSDGGSGPVGNGFSIDGLTSAITRCAHPHEQGGARRVAFDENDRFCLDGEPLLLVAGSGGYGAPGSRYRTEHESIREVVALEAGRIGLSGFDVYEPDGMILRYDTIVAPRRLRWEALTGPDFGIDEQPAILQWSLSRVRDRAGNGMELEYETGFVTEGVAEPTLFHRPATIAYTSWSPASGEAEVGRRRVHIKYRPRPDPRDYYLAGTHMRLHYLVERIEMHAPDASGVTSLAWYYAFQYVEPNFGSITGRSLLAGVARCDAQDICLPGTRFEWSRGSFEYRAVELDGRDPTRPTTRPAAMFSTQLGDVDGDGRDDLVERDHNGARVVFSHGSGFGSREAWMADSVAGAPLIADVTGDGRAELIAPEIDHACVDDSDCRDGAHCVQLPGEGTGGICASSCQGFSLSNPPASGACPDAHTCTPADLAGVGDLSCLGVDGFGPGYCCPPGEDLRHCLGCSPQISLETCIAQLSPHERPERCSCALLDPDPRPERWYAPGTSTCDPLGSASWCGDLDRDGVRECVSRDGFNGDGWRIHHFGGHSPLSPVTSTRSGQLIEGLIPLGGHGSISLSDFDGDGAPDLLRRDDAEVWSYGANTANRGAPFAAPGLPGEVATPIFFDPRTGIYDPVTGVSHSEEHGYGATIELLDVDSDARTDVLLPLVGDSATPNRYLQVALSPETGHHEPRRTNLVASHRDQILIDVNGDGLVDAVDLGARPESSVYLIPRGTIPGALGLRVNSGNGFTPYQSADPDGAYVPFWPAEVRSTSVLVCPSPDCSPLAKDWYGADLRYRVLDYNQDGLQDFLVLGPTPTIYVSTGSSFRPVDLPFAFTDALQLVTVHCLPGYDCPGERSVPFEWPATVGASPGVVYRVRRPVFLVGDVNGDGQPDFLHGEDNLVLHLSTGGRPDLLVGIRDGVGANHGVEYSTLGDDAVYDERFDHEETDDGPAPCGYPDACMNRRALVVRTLRYHNPGHPDRVVTYRYAGGRRDARTGGSLGFARVYAHDQASGEQTETWMRPTVELAVGRMRGAYHPLANRPERVYSAVPVGGEVHVARIDYRYQYEGYEYHHPLVERGFLERGLRVLLTDVFVRQYREPWSDWGASSGELSNRYVQMREARHVFAWRMDRRRIDYERWSCESAEPCARSTSGAHPIPYPLASAWTDVTYDEFDEPIDLVDREDPFLRRYDSDVVFVERTVLDRRDDEDEWLIGLPRASETERCSSLEAMDYGHLRCPRHGAEPSVLRRRSEYTYDANLVRTMTREPYAPLRGDDGEASGLRVRTTLERERGNITEIRSESTEGEVRRGTVTYDPAEHIFPQSSTAHASGELELTAWIGWHRALGVPLVAQAPNGAQSRARYDGLGRPRGTREPGGEWTSTSYSGTPGGLGMQVSTSGPAIVDSVVALDTLLRPTSVAAHAYRDARAAVTDQSYDVLGRPASTTLPHSAGSGAGTFETVYDTIGRLTNVRFRADGTASAADLVTFEHGLAPSTIPGRSLMRTRARDALGNDSESYRDLRGWVESARQLYVPEGAAPRWIGTRFERDLHGLPRSTSIENDLLTGSTAREITDVDRLGRPRRILDPDSGELEVRYNAFDQIVWQRDAEGLVTRFVYDAIGRLQERVDGTDETTTWVWDSVPNGAGLLAGSLSPDGHSISYEYDEHGRLVHEEHTDTGAIDLAYDASTGELTDLYYPATRSGARFHVQYRYEDGYLATIWDATTTTPALLWEARERRPDGRVRRERTGGGVETLREYDERTGRPRWLQVQSSSAGPLAQMELGYRANGELEHRQDAIAGRFETFAHDSLSRLTAWTRETEAGASTIRYRYDDRGNLKSVENETTGEEDRLEYRLERNAGPSAASEINGEELSYDLVGRQTVGVGGRRIEWTPLHLPRRVVSARGEVDYRYDAEGHRVEAIHWQNARAALRVRYLGRLYERREGRRATDHVCYVMGPEGTVAQVAMADAGPTREALYHHHDGLGSVALTSNGTGALVERYWYSPFGRRVDADGSFSPVASSQPELTRGFTGHEHDDTTGLINMGNRVYDPRLRRFVSPDPIVSNPASAQSWNPYSYVLNSPMNFIDPTGFQAAPDDRCSQCDFDEGSRVDVPASREPQGLSGVQESRLMQATEREAPASTDPGSSSSGGSGARPGIPWQAQALMNVATGSAVRDPWEGASLRNLLGIPTQRPEGEPPFRLETYFDAGFLRGISPFPVDVPSAPSSLQYPEAHREFNAGQLAGAATGLAVDAIGIVVGIGLALGAIGTGVSGAIRTGGASLALIPAGVYEGVMVSAGFAVAAAGHYGNLQGARAQLNFARASASGPRRPISLPAWRRVHVDQAHIAQRHLPGGSLTEGRSVFVNMNMRGVMRAIREAYDHSRVVRTQGDRILLQGRGGGFNIEMWFNRATNIIETAYPI